MNKVNIQNIAGKIAKKDDRYTVTDNTDLANLVLSSTLLKANCSTNGHFHVGQEEIYFFVDGSGKMELDEEIIHFVAGDIVQIPNGAFHKVSAGPLGAYFVCVFDGKRYGS
jgi:mannose-6-phosphate isomerase-like protein (cupin superfamily)